MRNRILRFASSTVLAFASVALSQPVVAQQVSPQLQPPANERLLLQVHAKGDQIYVSKSDAAQFIWALKAPDARLFDKDGKPFGKHFAGPSWEADDGSRVTGKAVANVSPDPDSIPWLLINILSAPVHKYNNVLFAVSNPSLLCCCWEGTDLPRQSPYKIMLTSQEREELERRANKYTLPYFMVARAKMILLAHQGLSNDQIADRLSTRREIVSRWRKRFFEKRLAGLEDCQRPGRPRVFPPRAGRAG